MLETDIYKLLATDAGVLAAMGGQNRVYLGMIPKGQTAFPALVVQTSFVNHPTTADGPVNFTMKRLQVDSYSPVYSAALALSDAVRGVLQSLSGALSTTSVQGTILRNEMDLPDEPGTTGYVFRRMLQVDIWYSDLN